MAMRRPLPGEEFKGDAGQDTGDYGDGGFGGGGTRGTELDFKVPNYTTIDENGNKIKLPVHEGQGAESPRERSSLQQAGLSGGGNEYKATPEQITSVPRQPTVPTPAPDNTVFQAGPPDVGVMQGLQPFTPMGGPSPVDMASPRLRGLYGNQGGLSGGGLGVPGSTSPAQNDPMQLLMTLLQR